MQPAARALVVDDSPAWLERAATTLTMLGYEVETASGAREAGRLAAAEQFSLMVTDNSMETPDAGIGLLIGLQALGREIPAVLYSSTFTEDQRAFLLRQLPHVQVVQKQDTPGAPELVEAIRLLGSGSST